MNLISFILLSVVMTAFVLAARYVWQSGGGKKCCESNAAQGGAKTPKLCSGNCAYCKM